MESIVTEIMEILKGSDNTILREENLMRYLSDLCGNLIAEALEQIDQELYRKYKEQGYYSQRQDERTVQSLFGAITYKRRLMKSPRGESCYPLDKELGWNKGKRYTPLLTRRVAEVASKSVYRAAAEAVTLLTPVSISHEKVRSIVKDVGNSYKAWENKQTEEALEEKLDTRRKPKVLYIEGDGVCLHGEGKKKLEIHRLQIYEGIDQSTVRHKLRQASYFADFNRSNVFEQAQEYLDLHYDLSESLVLTNSDGGSGYEQSAFEELVSGSKRHEHFLDKYHVNRKVKERLNFVKKGLQDELYKRLRRYDREEVQSVIDTAASLAETPEQEKAVRLLEGYINRNWPYLAPREKREIEDCEGLGTCESNHRIYSYRMKRQGRCWSQAGGLAMVKLITGLRNAKLDEAMIAEYKGYNKKKSRRFNGAVRMALKKSKFTTHSGIHNGGIANYASSSSPLGRLAKFFA